MLCIKIGEKTSAVIDQDNQLYTWGMEQSDQKSPGSSHMPALVEALQMKIVNSVAVGLDFVVALGQDFNEYGQVIEKSFYSLPKVEDSKPDQTPNQQSDIKHNYFSNQNQIHGYDNNISAIPKDDAMKESFHTNTNTNYSRTHKTAPTIEVLDDTKANENTVVNQSAQMEPLIPQRATSGQGDRSITQYQESFIKNKELANQSITSNTSGRSRENNGAPHVISNYQPHHQRRYEEVYSSSKSNPTSVYEPPQVAAGKNSTPPPAHHGGNAELYKQLDVAREEIHLLKQKNRELIMKNNQLRDENEQLAAQADEEIKRMSQFIDTYTAEFDQGKKVIEDEYERKLAVERQKIDEIKEKMHKD